MTASKPAASTAFEDPLMPNARLRQIYSAMLRLRMLADRLGSQSASKSRRHSSGSPLGLEACLVSPTVDLADTDLVCDALSGSAIDFLRGQPAEQVLTPNGRLRSSVTLAQCGAATRLDAPTTGPERLWSAAGAAAALKANSLRVGATDGAVLVCYARASDAAPAVWSRVLALVSAQRLPLLFVILPTGEIGSRTGHMAAVALRSRIPGMPVDQDDAVALYRVAQEAVGHARIGGGGALIECVRYVLEGRKPQPSDAIEGLAQYMLHRNVADKRWMEVEAKSFARRIGR